MYKEPIFVWIYVIVDAITFIYLMHADWSDINWWNWIIIIPVNVFLAQIWPIYWAFIHWLF